MDAVMFYLKPGEVVVNMDLPRFRQEMGDVASLAASIVEKGQLQPIVIDEFNRLICGGRRLAACIMANHEVLCRRLANTTELQVRELELMENLERKQFTPAEEAAAINAIHEMRIHAEGQSAPGTTDGWSLAKTAALLGCSKSTVARAIDVAEVVQQFPELATCKTQMQIQKAAQNLVRQIEVVEATSKHEAEARSGQDMFTVHHCDFREHIVTLEECSIDILFTDPVYGIEYNETIRTGSAVGSERVYDDSKDNALMLLKFLAAQSFRITHEKSHGFVFVGPEHFHTVQGFFREAGWEVFVKPIIWIKRVSGQNNQPSKWPSSCYEMAIYIRRKDAVLIKQGMPDWVDCPPLAAADRTYPSEKPTALLKHLLQRVAMPRMKVYDPFMGSGALLEAAFHERCHSIGCDISEEAYGLTLRRLCAAQRALEDALGK